METLSIGQISLITLITAIAIIILIIGCREINKNHRREGPAWDLIRDKKLRIGKDYIRSTLMGAPIIFIKPPKPPEQPMQFYPPIEEKEK